MKPYYSEDGITIYHADCTDVIPLIDPTTVDLLLTDPPYGINLKPEWSHRISSTLTSSWTKYGGWAKDHAPIVDDNTDFDPTPLLAFGNCIIFGGNYFASRLPDSSCWIVWDKKRGGTITPGWNSADAELAWTNVKGGVRTFSHLWAGFKRDSELGNHVHPTQKPVALMVWILNKWTNPNDLVFDPYMGSGPIAQACYQLGRRYIGVEIVEEYCQVAVNRLAQGVLPLET